MWSMYMVEQVLVWESRPLLKIPETKVFWGTEHRWLRQQDKDQGASPKAE